MKKSTVLIALGIIAFIGISYRDITSYSESINNMAIQEASTNITRLEQELTPSTKESLQDISAKDDNQLKQQVHSMMQKQAREALKGIGLRLGMFLLLTLFLSSLVSILVWLFQAIRRNFKQRKLSQRT